MCANAEPKGGILTRATTAVQPAEGPVYDLAAPCRGSAFSVESAGTKRFSITLCVYVCVCHATAALLSLTADVAEHWRWFLMVHGN